ncbi:peptidase S8/S53 domain-containing protein [Helicostylum pulchrum]|nr:peptidase S8/S53 domain-containing protein [Helicostylum pulchrum]
MMRSLASNLILLTVTFIFAYTIEATSIIPRSYIVEYVDADNHDTINNDLSQYQDLYYIHHTYSSAIFHGMSFSLKDPAHTKPSNHRLVPVAYSTVNDKTHPVFNHLSVHPAIKKIYPVYKVPRPQWMPSIKNASHTFPYANQDSQILDIHTQLGISGKDILIGILDSGIDYNHPALGGGFGEGFKVRYGKNLVTEASDKENGVMSLGKDDPYDPCTNNDAGHGTHVAGIIAGYDKKANFTGIAPNATLGFWRIFGCEGGAGEDTVIKAMEMAYEAGCQIINLSLGIENAWPEDAMAAVAENLSNKGVIVVGVAGNQGTNGVYSQNSPASGKSVISVASVDNSFYPANVMDINVFPEEYFPYMISSNTASFPNGTLASIITDGSVPFGCGNDTTITSENSNGKILLLKRGGCTFDDKITAAKEVGATSVLFYDPEAVNNALVVAKTKNDSLPCASIEKKLALQIIDYYSKNTQLINVTFPVTKQIVIPDTAGSISEFSSTGPTYELDLKPSIAGIGGDVYSTLPLHIDSGWGVRSGTSMAAPHVAGCAALLIEYYSEKKLNVTSSFITEHMQNHARIINAKSGIPEHPIVQGAGLIQPYDAIRSQVHVSPSQISFNDTASLTEYKTYSISILNSNSVPLLVSVENIQSNSILSYANDTSFVPTEPALTNGSLTVELEFSPKRNLLLSPLSTTTVQVKVVLPNPNQLFYHYQMYGGFISIKNVETTESLATIPYFGVLGKMIDLPLFDTGYPYLATTSNTEKRLAENSTFNFDLNRKVKTKPTIVVRLLTGTAKIDVKVYDENEECLGIISGGPWIYNQRNLLAEDNYNSNISWNGKFIPITENQDEIIEQEEPIGDNSTQVEDGTYYLYLRALRHFGDPDNKNDWKEWKSGPINVKN